MDLAAPELPVAKPHYPVQLKVSAGSTRSSSNAANTVMGLKVEPGMNFRA